MTRNSAFLSPRVLNVFQKPGSQKKNPLSGMSQYIPLPRDISTRKENHGAITLLQQPEETIPTTIYHKQPRDSPRANVLAPEVQLVVDLSATDLYGKRSVQLVGGDVYL
jgi:hypothetical protein